MNDQEQTAYTQVIKELTKAVDALREASHSHHEELSQNQKTLMHEVMNERKELEKEAEKNHQEEMRYQHRHTFISVLVLAASIFVGAYLGVRQYNLSELYKQATAIENRIDSWSTIYDNLMMAMANLRGIRDEGQSQCKNGHYAGLDPGDYQQRLFNAQYKLIGVAFGAERAFSPAVTEKIKSFDVDSDIDRLGVCAKGAPTDDDLMMKQFAASKLMLKEIHELEQQKNAIMEKIGDVKKSPAKKISTDLSSVAKILE